jgi:two-component system cell cycle response regulator
LNIQNIENSNLSTGRPFHIRVLLIEDSPTDVLLLREHLATAHPCRYDVTHVERLSEGLALIAQRQFDVVILDLGLPDSLGLETLIKFRREVWKLPVIVLTSLDDEATAIKALHEGAQDYLVKGHYDRRRLERSTRYALERHRLFMEQYELSLRDELTGAHNRRGFIFLSEQQIKLALRDRQNLLLAFADLDGLKQINDTFGHQVGDEALVQLAEVLRKTFRDSDVLGRVGGDEFAVLSIQSKSDSVRTISDRLTKALRKASSLRPYQLSVSLGVVVFAPSASLSIHEMMIRADEAMYAEKRGAPPLR